MNSKPKNKKQKSRKQELQQRRAAEAKFWAQVREESSQEYIQLEIGFKYDHEPRNRK